MKRFLIWLAVYILAFSGFGAAYHIYSDSHPQKIIIALDTSFTMNSSQTELRRELTSLDKNRYSEFCFVDALTQIADWQDNTHLRKAITYYGPRDLEKLAANAAQALEKYDGDRIIFITNAEDISALEKVSDSEVIKLNQ